MVLLWHDLENKLAAASFPEHYVALLTIDISRARQGVEPATPQFRTASEYHMSKVIQIFRGTAALPPDLEEQFLRAHGRKMNDEERRFFGLSFRGHEGEKPLERRQDRKAA